MEGEFRLCSHVGVGIPSPLVGEGGAVRAMQGIAREAPGEGLVPHETHHRPTAKRIRNFAKQMRREPTAAEAAMWQLLRDRRFSHCKFRRQALFQNYILDFVCFERRLVIETDGSQHADAARDLIRDQALASEGFQVVRNWNNDVLQRRTSVMEDIFARLAER